MGFADNQASLQTATTEGDIRLAEAFDGYVRPPPAPAGPVPAVGGTLSTSTQVTAPAAAVAAAASGPGFWSGIGSALHGAGTWLGDHVQVQASVNTAPAALPGLPPQRPYVEPSLGRFAPWAIVAGAVLLLLLLLRR